MKFLFMIFALTTAIGCASKSSPPAAKKFPGSGPVALPLPTPRPAQKVSADVWCGDSTGELYQTCLDYYKK